MMPLFCEFGWIKLELEAKFFVHNFDLQYFLPQLPSEGALNLKMVVLEIELDSASSDTIFKLVELEENRGHAHVLR